MGDDNPFDDTNSGVPEIDWQRIADAESLVRAVGATEVLNLLQRLGFWIGGGSNPTQPARQFNTDLANLSPVALGNEAGYWQSELSRVTSIAGALRGQQRRMTYRVKRRRDLLTADLIQEHHRENKKVPAQNQLAAIVSARNEILELEEASAMLDAVIIAFDAAKEAIDGYCRVLSRELTRRGDLLKAGIG